MSCETAIGSLPTKAPPAMNLSESQNFLVCVDRTPRSRVAVRYACRRARQTGGNVSLLHVIESPEFQHWNAVGDAMEEERRAEAEALLEDLAADVTEWAGLPPDVFVREGDVGEEILAQVRDDPAVDLLVVGAASPTDKSFSMISSLAGKLVRNLSIPLVVVPANLADEKIADVTQFEPMPYYRWTESMSVGIPLLDEDHKALIRLINRLHASLAAGAKFVELEDIFDRLVAYIEFHFTREEKVMEVSGYPFAAAHREEHEGFTQAIYEMRDRYAREGDQTMTAELPDYLKKWLNHHILVQDMAYKPYVKNNALADKVARAFGSWFVEDDEDEHRAIRHRPAAIDSDRYGQARAAARVAPTLDQRARP